MSKLTKFLLQNGSLVKENSSGSCYYKVAGKQIRLSDHTPPENVIEDLTIILPQGTKKQYIVIFLGHFYIHESFTSVRVFLEHWILLSKGYSKRLNCLECATIKKITKELSDTKLELGQLKQSIIKIVSEYKTKLELESIIPGTEKFTKKQLVAYLKCNSEKSRINTMRNFQNESNLSK